MPEKNLEVVRSMLDAYSAGDTEAVVATADEDIELRPPMSCGGRRSPASTAFSAGRRLWRPRA